MSIIREKIDDVRESIEEYFDFSDILDKQSGVVKYGIAAVYIVLTIFYIITEPFRLYIGVPLSLFSIFNAFVYCTSTITRQLFHYKPGSESKLVSKQLLVFESDGIPTQREIHHLKRWNPKELNKILLIIFSPAHILLPILYFSADKDKNHVLHLCCYWGAHILISLTIAVIHKLFDKLTEALRIEFGEMNSAESNSATQRVLSRKVFQLESRDTFKRSQPFDTYGQQQPFVQYQHYTDYRYN
eukprot:TRINITY_DN7634_c0_g1_i1.p1 TRINITY_DN7634_c0_g1~~TRINITY_DN7634_c0_g1_i1.p1  ORF type:complete len:243 (+),score=27.87 TRINITY_DN7634_c0_g1_i1:52-780(+)